MKSKNILITGGAGFIGSNLCERLHSQGHTIYCIDNLQTGNIRNINHLLSKDNFYFAKTDIVNLTSLDVLFPPYTSNVSFSVDEIYNLACPASPVKYQDQPIKTMMTCFNGTHNLLKIAHELGAKILMASTSEVYGDPKIKTQSENYRGNVNTVGPRACYDEGKRIAETLCYEYEKKGVDVKIARIFNTYGPKMDCDDGRVICNFINQIIRGEPLTVYGDGTQTRSFCYITDMLDGLIALMGSKLFGPVNLGNPSNYTINNIAEIISMYMSAPLNKKYLNLPVDDPLQRNPDISLAKEMLNWSPKVYLKDGLLETIEYFKNVSCDNI